MAQKKMSNRTLKAKVKKCEEQIQHWKQEIREAKKKCDMEKVAEYRKYVLDLEDEIMTLDDQRTDW